jgi:hypothetical protein
MALLQSLVGGFTIPVAAHSLLVLNGNIFGISGFVHRAVKGHVRDLVSLSGLILGGVVAARLEGKGPSPLSISLPQILLSGFLVGIGSKVLSYVSLNPTRYLIYPVSRWLHVRVSAENTQHDCQAEPLLIKQTHDMWYLTTLSPVGIMCSYPDL